MQLTKEKGLVTNMIYIPIKRPKRASYTAAAALLIAAGLYLGGEFLQVAKMIFQLTALALFAFGIMLIARYLLTDYKYVITDSDRIGKETSFTIVKISGKRETPVATFDLISVYACGRFKSTAEYEKANGRVDKVFNYCTNYRAEDRFAVAINFNEKKVLIFIEADIIFENEIKARTVGLKQSEI